jgi:hypothetical protein
MEATLYAAVKQARDALNAGAQPRLAIQWAATRFEVDPLEVAAHVIAAQRAVSAALLARVEELEDTKEKKPATSRKRALAMAA